MACPTWSSWMAPGVPVGDTLLARHRHGLCGQLISRSMSAASAAADIRRSERRMSSCGTAATVHVRPVQGRRRAGDPGLPRGRLARVDLASLLRRAQPGLGDVVVGGRRLRGPVRPGRRERHTRARSWLTPSTCGSTTSAPRWRSWSPMPGRGAASRRSCSPISRRWPSNTGSRRSSPRCCRTTTG